MNESVYNAMFGALTQEHRLDVIANNLANVNTTGYKQDQLAFEDVFTKFAHDNIIESKPYLRAKNLFPEPDLFAKCRISGQFVDQSQGSLRRTGNTLDLALQGEGFFRVDTPEGIRYTRNGHFQVDQDGRLVDANANPVQAGGGEVVLPPGARPDIGLNGQIVVDGEIVGVLDVVTLDDPRNLEKVGQNYFRAKTENAVEVDVLPAQAEVPEEGDTDLPVVRATVHQGFLEASNVNVVTEMVNMIEAQRAFEAYQKIMQNTQQADGRIMMAAGK
jgi:flagellar basal-body rod protein FlgG